MQDRNTKIAIQYRAGEAVEAIATEHGLAPGTVRRLVKKLKARRPGERALLERNQDIVSRYRQGEKQLAIAVDHGICTQRVQAIVARHAPELVRKRSGS